MFIFNSRNPSHPTTFRSPRLIIKTIKIKNTIKHLLSNLGKLGFGVWEWLGFVFGDNLLLDSIAAKCSNL